MRVNAALALVLGSSLFSAFANGLAIDRQALSLAARELSLDNSGSSSLESRAVQKTVIKQKTTVINPEGPVVVNQNAVVNEYQKAQVTSNAASEYGLPDCPTIQRLVVKQRVIVVRPQDKDSVNVKQTINGVDQKQQPSGNGKRSEVPATEEVVEDDSQAAEVVFVDGKSGPRCRKQIQRIIVKQLVKVKNPQDTVDVNQNVDVNQAQQQKTTPPVAPAA